MICKIFRCRQRKDSCELLFRVRYAELLADFSDQQIANFGMPGNSARATRIGKIYVAAVFCSLAK